MKMIYPKIRRQKRHGRAFTLVELLVVIAIMAILMTAGAIGLGNLNGKGVASGVATAESLFEEARNIAQGRNLRSCVLVAKTLKNNPGEDLRRILVACEEIDPATGTAKDPSNLSPNWEISSRGALLPDQTFYSGKLSNKEGISKVKQTLIDTISSSRIKNVKAAYEGEYYIYQFNSQGLATDPLGAKGFAGASSFVIGSGARIGTASSKEAPPRLTASASRDFGGFIIWKSGATSVFRNPDQAGTAFKSMKAGSEF
jgi:prepilin-type N-terminal cleavage/methylation domain-containing protein